MGTEQKILDLPARPRLLVICVARFGDTLLITPTLAALKQRWPQAQLTVLAHPARREILENLPFIDRLDTITKQRAPWCGRLPGRPYDAAIVYGDDLHLFAYARRVAWAVVGFAGNEAVRRASLTHAVPRPVGPTPAAFERTLLLLPFGLQATDLHLRYTVSPQEAAAAAAYVTRAGWPERRLVGLQLQSFPTKAYRDWPPAYFCELVTALLARYPDIHILLLGGPESKDLANRLADSLGERVSSAAGAFSMRENAAMLARLALYVGVDTGPTHLAGALDVPMVALYHCYHPGRLLAPQGHPALTVIEHPAAQPERSASMADIPVATVLAAACAHLDKS
ncbi:MAG TPA: glycosyltransferase family 9 protein [Azonexus sp.]|nr:glycosyltransferase family 9 protein [Azonexus sp.]